MSDFDEDGCARYIRWDFRPYNTVRVYDREKGWYLRENVFVRRWQNLMTRHAIAPVTNNSVMREDQWFIENEAWRYPVLKMFDGAIPSVRQTRIVSNFILFLGRDAGRAYIEGSQKLSNKFNGYRESLSHSFLAQWAIETRGNDYRAGVAQTDRTPLFPMSNETPAYEDVKTIERAVYWCGTPDGQSFLKSSELVCRRLARMHYPDVLKANKQKLKSFTQN